MLDVYYHPLFLEHETGEHPENKQRLVTAVQTLLDSGLDLEWITPEPAPAGGDRPGAQELLHRHGPFRGRGWGRMAGLGHGRLAPFV